MSLLRVDNAPRLSVGQQEYKVLAFPKHKCANAHVPDWPYVIFTQHHAKVRTLVTLHVAPLIY